MTRYAIRYQDRHGYGWTREVDAESPHQAIASVDQDPDVCRVICCIPMIELFA